MLKYRQLKAVILPLIYRRVPRQNEYFTSSDSVKIITEKNDFNFEKTSQLRTDFQDILIINSMTETLLEANEQFHDSIIRS